MLVRVVVRGRRLCRLRSTVHESPNAMARVRVMGEASSGRARASLVIDEGDGNRACS